MVQLYDYQIAAIRKMHNGCILNGGVGSGKSVTAIAYYYLLNEGDIFDNGEYVPMNDPPMDLYIITTAHKRDTHEWDLDMARFLISSDKEVDLYQHKVVVDSWNNISKYIGVRNAFFIFDEQRVVGSGTWVKAFLKIARLNKWILLSATPGDKWEDYIPVFIANGFYKNKTEFSREHLIYSNYALYPKVEGYRNTGKLIRLRNNILVDMDFNRETVPHHEEVWCDYDKGALKTILKDRWDIFQSKPVETASELCYLMRKVVNSDESRQVKLLEILEDHPKSIIFYNFDYELDILKGIFSCNECEGGDGSCVRRDWDKCPTICEVAEWNGHKHQAIPTSNRWVYLVQYTAGCEGWNCITTDTIIFFSQNYSYKVLQQAAGRIDRLNTPYKDLYYYHLKSHAGIDLAIARALAQKKKFNEGRYGNKILGKF